MDMGNRNIEYGRYSIDRTLVNLCIYIAVLGREASQRREARRQREIRGREMRRRCGGGHGGKQLLWVAVVVACSWVEAAQAQQAPTTDPVEGISYSYIHTHTVTYTFRFI